MSVLLVPLESGESSYRETLLLDGVQYQLKIRWNEYMGAWLVDVFSADGTPIVYGRRCVVDWPLLRQSRHIIAAPPGELVPFDTTNRQVDPAYEDFGSRVVLTYADAAALAGL